MTTYWVQFDFDMERHNYAPGGTPTPDHEPPLTFLGATIATPWVFPYSPFPYDSSTRWANVAQGYWAYVTNENGLNLVLVQTNIVEWDYTAAIGSYFVAGTQPDPVQLVGPTLTDSVEAAPDFINLPNNTYTIQWTDWAWQQITVPDEVQVSIAGPLQTVFNHTALYTVTLSSASSSVVTVNYATLDGSAKAPAEYTQSFGTVTFSPGETSKTVAVAVSPENLNSHNESFQVVLSNASGATIANGSAAATIDALFTKGSDNVDFTNLTADQQQAIAAGADMLNGLGGNDTVTLGNSGQVLNTGSLSGDLYAVYGGEGADTITGGTGVDRIAGGKGDDTIDGSGGDDVIVGIDSQISGATQSGHNRITGGNGTDTVLWSGAYETYSKNLSVSYKDFFLGNSGKLTISTASGSSSDELQDKIEFMKFAAVQVPYEQIQGVAGVKWGLESINKFIELTLKALDLAGENVPSELKTGVEWLTQIRSIIASAYDVANSPNVAKAAFIQSNLLLVNTVQAYLDTQVPGSHTFTAKYFDQLRDTVSADAGTTFDLIMKTSLPVAEDLGEWFGDFWFGVTNKVSPTDLQAPPSQPFIPPLTPIPLPPTIIHAQDGYLSGATVFHDQNQNGIMDGDEASGVTDSLGATMLPVSTNSGTLIALGGIDTSTGLAFKGQISAPSASTVITPLTTLLTILNSGALAEQKVLSSLDLSPSLDLTTFDPIAAAQAGSADGAATEVAGAKVYDTVEMIASVLAGTGASFNQALQDVFATVASALIGTGSNFSDKAALSTLITQVASMESLTLGAGVADAVASIIAAGNAALDQILQTEQPGDQLLSAVAAIELVMQGAASTAIADAGGNLTKLAAIADLFTGTNLAELISQAQIEVENPGQDLGPIAFDGSTSTDQNTVLNGAVSAVDLTGDSITYALDGAVPAGLTFHSDGTFSFDPKDTFKYLAFGESMALSFHFKALDDRGAVNTATETITINGLNDDPTATADGNGVVRGKTISETAAHGVLANDSDVDLHDQLAVVAVNGKASAVGHVIKGEYGSLTLNADGSYTYVANHHDHHHVNQHHGHAHHHGADDHGVAQDVFEYSISDGHGGLSTSSLSFVVFDKGTTYLSGVNTTVTAGKGQYVLDGSAGGDTLIAGKGGNVLIGGPGDTLIAGKGSDTFLFRADFGTNTLKNFDLHEDRLQFDHSIFSSVREVLAHTTDSAAGAAISDGHGDTVTLLGIKAAQLHSHDFSVA